MEFGGNGAASQMVYKLVDKGLIKKQVSAESDAEVTIVDLREEKEYVSRPCRLEKEEGFSYYHLPVTGGGDTPKSPEAVAETYLGISNVHKRDGF